MSPRTVVPAGLSGMLVGLAILTGCDGGVPAGPDHPKVSAARGGSGGSPTVAATQPAAAPVDVTLDVQVTGTNFTAGSAAGWLLDGKATAKVRTNSTRFVSATELVANITIAADATPELYDVQVIATNGKKGIGIEMFAVTGELVDLVARPGSGAPAGLYQDAGGSYDRGAFVAGSRPPGNFNIQPACARQRWMDLVLPAEWAALLPPPSRIANCDDASSGAGRRIQLHFPGLAGADCPDTQTCPIGGPHEPGNGAAFSPDVYYFFHVDANNDGKYGPPKEPSYDVVWNDARFEVIRRSAAGTPCQWHIVGRTARLWRGNDTALDVDRPVALDAVVTRLGGPCA